MKSYKKHLCIALMFLMLLALPAGCGSKNDDSDNGEFSYSSGIDDNGFVKGLKALDYIEMFDYQAMPIPSDVHQISEEDLQYQLDTIMSGYSTYETITDRAVADGDTVNIDYVGSIDGVEFDGGSTGGGGTDVTIGVTQYIDDFLEQLIGHMPGETINVEVTFDADYWEESLQSKDALFVTTINHISKEIPQELTDDFVETNFYDSDGWKTVEDLKKGIAEEYRTNSVRSYVEDYLFYDVSAVSVPDTLIKYQENAMLFYFNNQAELNEMDYEDFLTTNLEVSGEAELIEMYESDNLQNATYVLVCQAVAEDAGISVTDEDMELYLPDYSDYLEDYGLPYLKQYVLSLKVIDYVAENAVME